MSKGLIAGFNAPGAGWFQALAFNRIDLLGNPPAIQPTSLALAVKRRFESNNVQPHIQWAERLT